MEKQEIDKYFETWANKLGCKIEEIQAEYNNNLKKLDGLPDEEKSKKALQSTLLTFKKQLRSPAVGFEGMVIGVGDTIDMVARQRLEATKIFNDNPQQAIANGICDEEGNPLDTRQTWNDGRQNNRFGKQLPQHNWFRTIYGVAKKDDNYKPFVMSLNGEVAKSDIPIFKSVKFRAIDRNKTDNMFTLTSSTFTTFTPTETQINPVEILNKYCDGFKVKFNELQTYHDNNKDNFNRLAIIEGDVSIINLEPTSAGSRRLVLEDSDNFDIESVGLTCWIPERVNIDFEEGDRVLVVGRTAQGKAKDDEGNITDTPGDLMMNVYGILSLHVSSGEKEVQTSLSDW